MTTDPIYLLLSGVVGSRGYGTDRPGSDIDMRGVFANPTDALLRLNPPTDFIESKRPSEGGQPLVDTVYWEAAKYMRLLLACNPNTLELVWLDHHETVNPWGYALLGIRQHLLSAKQVRDRYLGYATGQIKMIQQGRGPTEKHARHVYRLLVQGYDLYRTGRLTVRLTPAQIGSAQFFADQVADGNTTLALRTMAKYEGAFDRAASPLPDRPDTDAAEGWLAAVRDDYYRRKAD